jgi:hypothetical protein
MAIDDAGAGCFFLITLQTTKRITSTPAATNTAPATDNTARQSSPPLVVD